MREYERLAAAIVLKAITDYDDAVKMLNNNKSSNELICKAERKIESIENFVKSEWYTELSNISRCVMLDRLAKIKSGELKIKNAVKNGV